MLSRRGLAWCMRLLGALYAWDILQRWRHVTMLLSDLGVSPIGSETRARAAMGDPFCAVLHCAGGSPRFQALLCAVGEVVAICLVCTASRGSSSGHAGVVPWVLLGALYALVHGQNSLLREINGDSLQGGDEIGNQLLLLLFLAIPVSSSSSSHSCTNAAGRGRGTAAVALSNETEGAEDKGKGGEKRNEQNIGLPAGVAYLSNVSLLYLVSVWGHSNQPDWNEDATAVANVLTDVSLAKPIGRFLGRFPALCALLTRGTMFIEGCVPYMLWAAFAADALRYLSDYVLPCACSMRASTNVLPRHSTIHRDGTLRAGTCASMWVRTVAVLTLMSLHLGLGMAMALGWFQLVCIAQLLPLIPEPVWEAVEVAVAKVVVKSLLRATRRWPTSFLGEVVVKMAAKVASKALLHSTRTLGEDREDGALNMTEDERRTSEGGITTVATARRRIERLVLPMSNERTQGQLAARTPARGGSGRGRTARTTRTMTLRTCAMRFFEWCRHAVATYVICTFVVTLLVRSKLGGDETGLSPSPSSSSSSSMFAAISSVSERAAAAAHHAPLFIHVGQTYFPSTRVVAGGYFRLWAEMEDGSGVDLWDQGLGDVPTRRNIMHGNGVGGSGNGATSETEWLKMVEDGSGIGGKNETAWLEIRGRSRIRMAKLPAPTSVETRFASRQFRGFGVSLGLDEKWQTNYLTTVCRRWNEYENDWLGFPIPRSKTDVGGAERVGNYPGNGGRVAGWQRRVRRGDIASLELHVVQTLGVYATRKQQRDAQHDASHSSQLPSFQGYRNRRLLLARYQCQRNTYDEEGNRELGTSLGYLDQDVADVAERRREELEVLISHALDGEGWNGTAAQKEFKALVQKEEEEEAAQET